MAGGMIGCDLSQLRTPGRHLAFLIIPEPEYSRRTHRSVVAVVTSPTTLVSAVARALSQWQRGHCGCRIEPVRTTGSRSMICGTSRNGTVTCALGADMLTRGWDVMRHQRGAARVAASAAVTDEPPKPGKKAARTASRQRTKDDVRGCGTHASPPSSGSVTAWPVAESSPSRVNSRKTAAVWQYLTGAEVLTVYTWESAGRGESSDGLGSHAWPVHRDRPGQLVEGSAARCRRTPTLG